MAADYLLAGRKWNGPAAGINWAGCIAWLLGFLVGIPEKLGFLPLAWVKAENPASLYSFAMAFLAYILLTKMNKTSSANSAALSK
jgi:cytosine permease